MTKPPESVLSEALEAAIGGRRVTHGVFLTYDFEPAFFELHVLPRLFNRGFSPMPNVCRAQLDDALCHVDHLAVYYDLHGLNPANGSATLDYERFALSRPGGVFHAKHIFLIVENQAEDARTESLIIVTTSANLTEAGWWRNVEIAHITELYPGEKTWLRHDLLGNGGLIAKVKSADATKSEHLALDKIRHVLQHQTQPWSTRSANGILRPRLYVGREHFADFLAHELKLKPGTMNLEIMSPYFENTGDAKTLRRLLESLQPIETRLFLPRADDGKALVNPDYYHVVKAMDAVSWATLPSQITRYAPSDERSSHRFVHVKLYRLFNPSERKDIMVAGSVNLTAAAHTGQSSHNFESAIVWEVSDAKQQPDWWLEALPTEFGDEDFIPAPTEDGVERLWPHQVWLRFDWRATELSYYWSTAATLPKTVTLHWGGINRFDLTPIQTDAWMVLPEEWAASLRQQLVTSTVVKLIFEDHDQEILVRECGMEQKPSPLAQLTPEEILEYWSLLSEAQRDAYLDQKMADAMQRVIATQGAEQPGCLNPHESQSMFDQFAGIFHAFSCLRTHIDQALEKKREKEATYRLFGQKHDSLPALLNTLQADPDRDPVTVYVTLLCGVDVLQTVHRRHPEFITRHQDEWSSQIQRIQDHLDRVKRSAFTFAPQSEREPFFAWFEEMFFRLEEVAK